MSGNSNSTDNKVNTIRRRFLVASTATLGTAGIIATSIPFLRSWNPNARARAAGAPVRVDVSKIERGAMISVGWRGRPVYILRRTPDQLSALNQLNDVLADPESLQSDQPEYASQPWRSSNPEYLIVIGLCTHLGCTPKLRGTDLQISQQWIGGFFCPCHGSLFDFAGRVYKGVPAPYNLPIPPYFFTSPTVVIIGEDEAVTG